MDDQPTTRSSMIVPMIVGLSFLMEQLDATIITTAVPEMARSLSVTPLEMNLAVTAYVLTLAVFIPLSGWLADRFGARRVFIAALATFTLASLLCGIAQSFAMLVAMRALQGLGGAMMTPVGRLIMIRAFPRSELVTAMTYMSLPVIIGPLAGPLLGGILTTYLSWRWIFYVNLPFGLTCIALALTFIRPQPGDPELRFDFRGFLLVGSGVALLQIAMDSVGRPELPRLAIPGFLAGAAAMLFGFVRYARTAAMPVVDLTLFQLRSFSIGTLAGGICRIALNGTPFLLPLMLQVGFGMSPVISGSLVMVGGLGGLMVRGYLAAVLRWFGFGRVLTGTAVLASAILAGFALIGPETPHWIIGGHVFLFGLVRATQFLTSNMLSYVDAPDRQLSQATSLFGVLQQLTVSVGVSLGAMLLWAVSFGQPHLVPAHFHLVYLLTAILPLLTVPSFLRLEPEVGAHVSRHRA